MPPSVEMSDGVSHRSPMIIGRVSESVLRTIRPYVIYPIAMLHATRHDVLPWHPQLLSQQQLSLVNHIGTPSHYVRPISLCQWYGDLQSLWVNKIVRVYIVGVLPRGVRQANVAGVRETTVLLPDQLDSIILSRILRHNVGTGIGAAVVDTDRLPIRIGLCKNAIQASAQKALDR